MGGEALSLISVPLFTGAIGYVTNWTGVWMLFYPVYFKGKRVPGLASIVAFMPRKVQQIPGVMHGGLGWQGIIPSRAAKMGSIAVDKGISKVGSPREFYAELDPETIAEHILRTARGEIRELVERIMEREHADLWGDLPPALRETVHERVQQQLPDIVRSVTEGIGANIDQLLDIKLMVIQRMEEDPSLAIRVYQEVGKEELRFIINFGFWFGLVLGIPTAILTEIVFHAWWLLPLLGVLIGYTTNLLGIKMIFEPVDPHRIGPFTVQGFFIKRQHEVSDIYARIIADDIITISNIGDQLTSGPAADRTRRMIETAMGPAVDRAVGPAQPAVRVAVGTREYDAIRDSVATEAVDYTTTPLSDPALHRRQSPKVREMIASRMRELAPADFSEMLRTAMREDEWLLYLHGAVLGFGGGLIHLAIFG